MAGTLVITTLSDGTNSTSATNPIQGSAKAWGSYASVGAGSVPTLRKAYNISSITRNSTGNYTFAFTNALADANFGVVVTANQGSTTSTQPLAFPVTKSTSSFTVQAVYPPTPTVYDFGVDFVVND
jgi:hypothetical protein